MGGPLPQVIVGVVSLLLLILGVVLLALSLRGRWLRSQPHCARCGQIVAPTELATLGGCPECGAQLGAAAGTLFFTRRIRPVMLGAGIAAFLLGLVVPLVGRTTVAPAAGPLPLPSSLTIDEILDGLDPDAPFARRPPLVPGILISELRRRTNSEAPSPEQYRRLLAILSRLSTLEAMALAPHGFGPLLEAGHGVGAFDEASLRALANQWYPPEKSIRLPPRVRDGETVRLADQGSRAIAYVLMHSTLLSLNCGDHPVDVRAAHPRSGEGVDLFSGALVRITQPPGDHSLRATIRRELFFNTMGVPRPRPPARPPGAESGASGTSAPVFTEVVTVDLPLRVMEKDAPSFIELRNDPARAAEVRAACIARALAIDPVPEPASAPRRCSVLADVRVEPLRDMAMSFDIVAVLGDVEVPLGSWTLVAAGSRSSHSRTVAPCEIPCPDSVPQLATVRFIPAPKRVESDPLFSWIWGEVMEIPDVPVRTMLPREGSRTP